MAATELLIGAVLVGLASGALISLLRAAPFPERWKAKKPLGCATCMGWWVTFPLYLLLQVAREADGLVWLVPTGTAATMIQVLVATAIATWLNHTVTPPVIHVFESKE